MADSYVREVGVVLLDTRARTVPLGGDSAAGRVALVDAADHEEVSRHSWSATSDPRRRRYPYAGARVDGATILMHKFLTGYPQTDHRNQDELDNRRSNLRPVTRSQNNANQRARPGGA